MSKHCSGFIFIYNQYVYDIRQCKQLTLSVERHCHNGFICLVYSYFKTIKASYKRQYVNSSGNMYIDTPGCKGPKLVNPVVGASRPDGIPYEFADFFFFFFFLPQACSVPICCEENNGLG